MELCLPLPVQKALDLLTNAGHEAYLVGGCVRDALRGIVPHDYDIATSALPDQTLAVFGDYRTIATGMRHGTITVLIEGMSIEITTYRVDGEYADHRRPDEVHFTSSLIEDLARRDFTINAMAYHPDHGLIDPFSGQKDLSSGILRAVGEPLVRFSEDALRILRALRFSARFEFCIEENTAAALRTLADTLSFVAPERVREEFFGILMADAADCVIAEYKDILGVVVPQGAPTVSLSRFPSDDIVVRLAEYFASVGESEAKSSLLALRCDNKTILAVCRTLCVYQSEIKGERECICRLLRKVGEASLRKGLFLRRIHGLEDSRAIALMENILATDFPYTPSMLAVGGEDLVALGVPRGPSIGNLLEILYTAAVCGDVENKKEKLLDYIKRYI